MTGFSDLANEIVLQIFRFVAPADLDSACHINKSIARLTAPILQEHRMLKRRLSFLELSDNYYFCDHVRHVHDYLIRVLAKPRHGSYVRGLIMDCRAKDINAFNGYRKDWHEDERDDNKSKVEDKSLVRAALEKVGSVEEVDKWLRSIKGGPEYDLILTLFLLHLPNLETLKLISTGLELKEFLEMSRRLKDAALGAYLSQLKSLDLEIHQPWATGSEIGFFAIFMPLPSLTSLRIKGLMIWGQNLTPEHRLRPHESNVSDLEFDDCHVSPEVVSNVLESTKSLRSFTYKNPLYHNEWRRLGHGDHWDWLIHLLWKTSSHSLERLTLLGLDERSRLEQPNLTGIDGASHLDLYLRQFKVLREISVDLELSNEPYNPKDQTFSKKFPQSTRIIGFRPSKSSEQLKSKGLHLLRRLGEAVKSILENKDVLLPQLTEIRLFMNRFMIYQRDASTSFVEHVTQTCEAQGISLTVE